MCGGCSYVGWWVVDEEDDGAVSVIILGLDFAQEGMVCCAVGCAWGVCFGEDWEDGPGVAPVSGGAAADVDDDDGDG